MVYIIVKRPQPGEMYDINDAVHPHSRTAQKCGVTQESFGTRTEAQIACNLMHTYNPGVDYGVVPAYSGEAIDVYKLTREDADELHKVVHSICHFRNIPHLDEVAVKLHYMTHEELTALDQLLHEYLSKKA